VPDWRPATSDGPGDPGGGAGTRRSSGYSLCAGSVTNAAEAGASVFKMMEVIAAQVG
jgi:hypothetical protein